MVRRGFLILGVFLVGVLLAGQDEDCEDPNLDIVLVPTFSEVGPEAGEIAMELEFQDTRDPSTVRWSASANADWITLPRTSGTGNATLTVVYAANPNAAAREAKLTVQTQDHFTRVTIRQAARTAGDPPMAGFVHVSSIDTVLSDVLEVFTAGNGAVFFSSGIDAAFPAGGFLPTLNGLQVRPEQPGVLTAPSPIPDFGGASGPLDPGAPGEVSNGLSALQLQSFGTPGRFVQTPSVFTDFDYGDELTVGFPGGADIGPFTVNAKLPMPPIITLPAITPVGLENTFDLRFDQPLLVNWETDGVELGDFVTITLVVQILDAASAFRYGDIYVATEDDGEFEIPGPDLSLLPQREPGERQFATLTVGRYRLFEADAPLLDEGDTGTVGVMTGASFPATSNVRD